MEKMKETYINNLYRAVLMRDPDGEGMSVHLKTLGDRDSLSAANQLLESFLSSGERKGIEDKFDQKVFASMSLQGVDDYRNIISIGSHCAASGQLKRFGLKRASYPFDWIFSSLGMAADCISDRFDKFLDSKYHLQVPPEFRIYKDANFCQHTYYLDNFGVDFVFNHRDISVLGNYEYYKRCVGRFIDVIDGNSPTLLMGLVQDVDPNPGFNKLVEALEGYEHMDLVVVNVAKQHAISPVISESGRIGRHRLFNFNSFDKIGPVQFENIADEMIFREFLKRLKRVARAV